LFERKPIVPPRAVKNPTFRRMDSKRGCGAAGACAAGGVCARAVRTRPAAVAAVERTKN
jgi:hypothetical protein